MPLMLMDEVVDDAKKRILDRFKGFAGVEIFANRVLVAVYQRSDKTKSGLYIPDQTKGEDKYQGKVGLVVQMGPQAFVDDEKVQFPVKIGVGDWVIFKPANGWPLVLDDKDGHCRVLEDTDIEGVVQTPDAVW